MIDRADNTVCCPLHADANDSKAIQPESYLHQPGVSNPVTMLAAYLAGATLPAPRRRRKRKPRARDRRYADLYVVRKPRNA